MTETEHVRATNRVKVSAALTILRDVLPGDDFGITEDELGAAISALCDYEEQLFASFECKEEPEPEPCETCGHECVSDGGEITASGEFHLLRPES